MKILATSDLHGSRGLWGDILHNSLQKNNPDILTISGDIAPTSNLNPRSDFNQLEWFETEFFKFMYNYPDLIVIMTLGNHDYINVKDLQDLIISHNLNNRVFILLNETCVVNGITFYGNPYSPPFMNWNYNTSEDNIYSANCNIPENVDVFISHSPAISHNDSIDEDKCVDLNIQKDLSLGSYSILKICEQFKPKYLLVGHIHSGSHRESLINNYTRSINVSLLNEKYQPEFEPYLIEIN